jgi:hypothetical protein
MISPQIARYSIPLLDDTRATEMIDLAHVRFDRNLSEAEVQVLRDSASSLGLTEPGQDAERREIRPELVRWLASDPRAAALIDPKGIRVWGFSLSSDLDLGFSGSTNCPSRR